MGTLSDPRAVELAALKMTTPELFAEIEKGGHSPEVLEVLNTKMEFKVDGYEAHVESLEEQLASMQGIVAFRQDRLKEAQAAAKSIQSKIDSHFDFLAWYLQRKGIEEWPGMTYRVVLTRSRQIEIDECIKEPDSRIYNAYPDLIQRSYGWKKVALKAAIDSGAFKHDNIRVKINVRAKFKLLKGE